MTRRRPVWTYDPALQVVLEREATLQATDPDPPNTDQPPT